MNSACVKIENLGTSHSIRPTWSERHHRRHGYFRLADEPAIPNGRRGRVTVYRRGEPDRFHRQNFILYWCAQGKRRKERVVGDKFDAIRRADEINDIIRAGGAGVAAPVDKPETLIDRFLDNLTLRADAGEISPRTVRRYAAALEHFRAFLRAETKPAKRWLPNREMVLSLKRYLQGRAAGPIPNAANQSKRLSQSGIGYVTATVRALVRWAIQESLLPRIAEDAFVGLSIDKYKPMLKTWTEPVTTEEILAMTDVADLYQLTMLSFYLFHGARVSEPCWLMIEHVDQVNGWLEYRSIEELGYRTKGRVDKRLPIPEVMMPLIKSLIADRKGGLLLRRRSFPKSDRQNPTAGLLQMVDNVARCGSDGWRARFKLGYNEFRSAGGLDGDDVRREFEHLRIAAGIRRHFTPKALRHYFATALEEGGIPYFTRKYLLGHRMSSSLNQSADATSIYTHLKPNVVKTSSERLINGPMACLSKRLDERFSRAKSLIRN